MSPAWMKDPERNAMVCEGLRRRSKEFRKLAGDYSKAFNMPYLKEPSAWAAVVYNDVADMLEARLAEIEKA